MKSNNLRRVNYQARFDQYLNQYRRRTRSRNTAITIGAIVFAAVSISLFTAVFAETLSYSKYLYYPARFLLVITLLCLLVYLFWKPRKTLNENDGATQIEASVPAFDGRVETYIDLKRREVRSPFVSLLAKDASRTAARTPVKTLLPTSEIVGPMFATAGMLALAAWLFTALPTEWRAGLQHLWFGWYKTDILPERSLAVTPGDTKIRLGDSLVVTASTTGFESDLAQLHIRKQLFGNSQEGNLDQPAASHFGEWEVVEMNRPQTGEFNFTLYGVSDPLEYYVSSAFTKSDSYTVEVVIPPKVENIQLTYTFPPWTGREPHVIADGGEVAAVEGTVVELLIETDKPLQHGELLLNKVASKLTPVTATSYTAEFTVGNTDGEYQLAELLGDDRIMLTDVINIFVTEDAKPTISFSKPGGDWSATSIEEVTVAATAEDDFEIREVILHYSVNGGDWSAQPLDDADGYRHTFMLEEFKNELGGALLPGDLVTYYAEAKDREQTVSTDIQFIDVKPFERRFTQSQQAGGGGGGGQQEPPPGEISQRQKEILVATWNLIRDQNAAIAGSGSGTATGSGGGGSIGISGNGLRTRGIGFALPRRQASDSVVKDNAELLAELQNTLADQAETLAQRAEARQLSNNDPKVAQFVEYIRKAAEAMRPSADQLSAMSLQEAVQHQQQALQFLRRGELLFNDITINQNQGNGNGGGNNAGRDMAEIYELEMDLAKNQYETPDSAPQGGSPDQSQDDAFDKLKDLARRQQELARSSAEKNELTSADRWEQEKLRRELEELKRELEQLQREQASSDQQAQQSQSQSSQSDSQQGESQPNDSQSQSQNQSQSQSQAQSSGGGQSESSETQEALQNLEQALRELENADQNSTSAQEQSQAMQAASERLQQSLDNIEQARQQRLQSQLADASDQVRDLMRQQTETAQELREALQRSIEARAQNLFDNGLSPLRSEELADQKRAMQRQLEAVQQDIADAIKRFDEQAPQTAERLQQALDELDRNKAAELMGISGDLIDDGMAPQASLREPRITEALRNLQNDLSDASELASDEAQQPVEQTITAADATRSLRESRQALTEALNRARGDQQNRNRGLQRLDASRAGTEESPTDQQSNSQQNSEQQGGEQPSDRLQQGQSGQSSGNSATEQSANSGIVRSPSQQISDTQLIRQATEELEQLGNGDIEGLSTATVEEFTDLARRLRETDSSSENDQIIDAEVRLLLRQLEQLELKVYNESQGISGVRTGKRSSTPKGYDRRSADYFRRLSKGDQTSNGS